MFIKSRVMWEADKHHIDADALIIVHHNKKISINENVTQDQFLQIIDNLLLIYEDCLDRERVTRQVPHAFKKSRRNNEKKR